MAASLSSLLSKLASELGEGGAGGANTLSGSEALRLRGGMLAFYGSYLSAGPYIYRIRAAPFYLRAE